MSHVEVLEANGEQAVVVRDVISASRAAAPHLDPPTGSGQESTEVVAAALAAHGGLVCRVDGVPAGALVFEPAGSALLLRAVSTLPRFESYGVTAAAVEAAELVAATRGYDDVQVAAPSEPAAAEFWSRRGYRVLWRDETSATLGKALPVEVSAPSAADARSLGANLGRLCTAGDVVIITGRLGAGKTTLVQGMGEALQVRGGVTSPTFVISRIHPSLVGGPALVHVDAYRLGQAAELDDLDLDAYVEDAVTVVEWGEGIAETLAQDRLWVDVARASGGGGDDARTVTVTPVGVRWFGTALRSTLLAAVPRAETSGMRAETSGMRAETSDVRAETEGEDDIGWSPPCSSPSTPPRTPSR